ncbi:hypothetical protein [Azospirillum cavernae]|uniref:hypothetical protein n=1 Tax=Azospirillum cavernae TaxID=2320860 RepID=UPI0011C35C87|nr:hypothetical protein [Azospirillum cavernae]
MADEYELQLETQIADFLAEIAAMKKRTTLLKEQCSALRSALDIYRKSRVKRKLARKKNQRELVLELLEEVWPRGLKPRQLVEVAKKQGYVLNENTVASHLSRALKAGLVGRTHLHEYIRPPGGYRAKEATE